MPDDLSWDDFGASNPDGPRTPAVDALARSSVRLTDFHVSPTCSPTRAALLTGRYNNTTGVWHTILGRYFLHPDEITAATIFRAAGYRTALFGKWHLGDSFPLRPQDRGFEHVVMLKGGGIDQQHNPWGNRDIPPAQLFVNGQATPLQDEPDKPGSAYTTTFFTSQTIAYLRERAQRAEPFFALVAYNVAHVPHDMPPGARPGLAVHEAVVEHMDAQVGRLLRTLDETGLAEDTIVVFLTDNGAMTRRFRAGKSSAYEGGHRVPCFIRWPRGGVGGSPNSGRDMPRLAAHIDLLPTLLECTGLPDLGAQRTSDLALHGTSLHAWIVPSPQPSKPAAVNRTLAVDNQRLDRLQYGRQACVMRDETDASGGILHKWRLVSNAQDWELYDVQADPSQATNLRNQPVGLSVAADLRAYYDTWWTLVSARADDYVRPIVGDPREPSTCLYAHDWHTEGNVPWNQSMVAEGLSANGFLTVQFARTGTYVFDLRRWPREIAAETTLTSTLTHPLRGVRNRPSTLGQALPIRSARLRVWQGDHVYYDDRQNVRPEADGIVFTVTRLPAGPASVQTWFYDAAGRELAGAYYVYVDTSAPSGTAQNAVAPTEQTTGGRRADMPSPHTALR